MCCTVIVKALSWEQCYVGALLQSEFSTISVLLSLSNQEDNQWNSKYYLVREIKTQNARKNCWGNYLILFFLLLPLLQHLSVADAQKIASHNEFILQSKDLEDSSRDGCLLIIFKSKMVQGDIEVYLLKTGLSLSIISVVVSFTSWCCNVIKALVHRHQWSFTYWKGYIENTARLGLCKSFRRAGYNWRSGLWKKSWENWVLLS